MILMVKLETRHPVEGSFAMNFRRSVIIAELRQPEVARPGNLGAILLFFLWKNDPSQTVATVQIAPKICQGQPPTFGSHCSRFHPNRFTFGGVIAKQVKTVFDP